MSHSKRVWPSSGPAVTVYKSQTADHHPGIPRASLAWQAYFCKHSNHLHITDSTPWVIFSSRHIFWIAPYDDCVLLQKLMVGQLLEIPRLL